MESPQSVDDLHHLRVPHFRVRSSFTQGRRRYQHAAGFESNHSKRSSDHGYAA